MYIVKTKEEFIKEFGRAWRDMVDCTWASPEMDYLYGTKLMIDFPNDKDYISVRDYYNREWTISRDMIKSKPKEPSYKPRKIIREI